MRRLWLAGLGMLAACQYSPYQPARLTIPGGFPEDVFDRTLAVLQQGWLPLVQVDPDGFRLQTDWLPHDYEGTPGQKRATVFLDDPVTLAVLVEVRYLRIPAFGGPEWSAVRGDAALENQLLASLRQALGGT